jgi:hypothetical protein
LAAVEPAIDHAEQALRFVHVTLKRAFVLVFLAREFVEKSNLPKYRPDAADLEMDPLNGLDPARGVERNELAGFAGEIVKDRPGFEESERLSAGTVRIEDRRNLSIWIERQEFRCVLVVLAEIDQMRLVRQSSFLKHDRDLHAVRRRQRVELQAVRIFRRPAFGNRKGGEVRHVDDVLPL